MAAFPSFAAGNQITAQKLNDMQADALVASALQKVTNSTTFVSDNALIVPVVANASYFLEFFLIFDQSGASTANVKTVWSVPTGTQGVKQVTGPSSGTFTAIDNTNARVAGHLLSTGVTYSMGAVAAKPIAVVEKAAVSIAGTSGNITVQFAQNTAQAQDLNRQVGSFVRVTRYN